MKNFLKDNIILVAGITLPLLLALVFFMSAQFSVIGREQPKTKVIYATGFYDSGSRNGMHDFDITEGNLAFRYNPPEKGNFPSPRLFVYDPVTNQTQEIDIPDYDVKKKFSTDLSFFKGMKMNDRERSPDGFTLEKYNYRNNTNLMTELFGGGSHRNSNCSLQKDGFRREIPQSRRNDCSFIGWITE